jgi:hypothetical protein
MSLDDLLDKYPAGFFPDVLELTLNICRSPSSLQADVAPRLRSRARSVSLSCRTDRRAGLRREDRGRAVPHRGMTSQIAPLGIVDALITSLPCAAARQ